MLAFYFRSSGQLTIFDILQACKIFPSFGKLLIIGVATINNKFCRKRARHPSTNSDMRELECASNSKFSEILLYKIYFKLCFALLCNVFWNLLGTIRVTYFLVVTSTK